MIQRKCKVNKDIDLGYTIPDQAIDIVEAIETGVVKNSPVSPTSYNLIDDPVATGAVVRDGFTAADSLRAARGEFINSQNES